MVHRKNFIENKQKISDVDFISDAAKIELTQDTMPFNWEAVKDLMLRYNIGFVSFFDEHYPALLKHIFDPPPFLFFGEIFNMIIGEELLLLSEREKLPIMEN